MERFLKLAESFKHAIFWHQLAQSWEMKLVYPAFALTAANPYCRIMLYQFDGFSAQFTRRPADWTGRIKDVVDARAFEFGIPTWLEWDNEQLADLELASIYEELMNEDDYVNCTLEDEETYRWLSTYYLKE